MRVAILDVNRQGGEALGQQLGAGASFHLCDVSDAAAVERIAAAVEQEGPPVRVLGRGFLCSPAARAITGITLPVDAGWLAAVSYKTYAGGVPWDVA